MTGTLATAQRVLRQLSHDPRSLVMIVAIPPLLMLLFKYIYNGQPEIFNRAGPQLLGLFPFIIMFVLTSVTMVRERTSGTLERLLTTPLRRSELISGYTVSFGLTALVQALVTAAIAIWVLNLDVDSPAGIILVAVLGAILGTTLGLLMSAFANTEFQAVQFMPLVVVPQFLLCGILVPRSDMPDVLHAISVVLPLSYVTDAFVSLAGGAADTSMGVSVPVIIGCCVAAVLLASMTLRRQTP